MAKRFTDTNKYKKPFIRTLPGAYKLLWDFLYHDCDHAGIWIVDFEIAQTYVGNDMPVSKANALKYFNSDESRIIEIDGGKKWFVPSFIEFQYGVLSEKNRAHINVISVLRKHNLLGDDLSIINNKPLTSPLQGAKEKELEQEQETGNGKSFGKSENLLTEPEPLPIPEPTPQGIVPEMLQTFIELNQEYPVKQDVDFPALREVGNKIVSWLKLPGDLTNSENQPDVRRRWGELVTHAKAHSLYQSFSISQINKHFQSICQSFNSVKNGTNRQSSTASDSGKPGTSEARIQAAKNY